MEHLQNQGFSAVDLEEEPVSHQEMVSTAPGSQPVALRPEVRWWYGLLGALILTVVFGSVWQVVLAVRNPVTSIPFDPVHVVLVSRTYPVTVHPLLVITNHVGGIFVHAGGVRNQVIIKSVETQSDGSEHLEDQAVGVVSNNRASLLVTVDGPQDSTPGVYDLDVTVNSQADLVLDSLAGDIQVRGVVGNEDITTEGGTIKLSATMLERSSKFTSENGNIFFAGQVERTGHAFFRSETGNLDLRLPPALPLELWAQSLAGKVTPLPGLAITGQRDGSIPGLYLSQGDFPRASITAASVSGSVTIGLD